MSLLYVTSLHWDLHIPDWHCLCLTWRLSSQHTASNHEEETPVFPIPSKEFPHSHFVLSSTLSVHFLLTSWPHFLFLTLTFWLDLIDLFSMVSYSALSAIRSLPGSIYLGLCWVTPMSDQALALMNQPQQWVHLVGIPTKIITTSHDEEFNKSWAVCLWGKKAQEEWPIKGTHSLKDTVRCTHKSWKQKQQELKRFFIWRLL